MKISKHIPKELVGAACSVWKKFDQTSALVKLVADGKASGLLLAGQPGIGKSRIVINTLASTGMIRGLSYMHRKGYASPLGFYQLLYRNPDILSVLDDYDKILRDRIGIDMLKAVLDHDKQRTLSYDSTSLDSKGMKRSFDYTGQLIFISNQRLENIDEAVYSRCLKRDLVLDPDEILARMYDLIYVMEPETDIEIKLEVIQFLNDQRDVLYETDRFNLRVFSNAIDLHSTGRNDWKDLVMECA